MRLQSCSPQSWACSDQILTLPTRYRPLLGDALLRHFHFSRHRAVTLPLTRNHRHIQLPGNSAPIRWRCLKHHAAGSCSAISVSLCFPPEPGWLSVSTMKPLSLGVFFLLVPTLVPALDPLSASLLMGGAAVTWQLFSPHSWLKCRLLECCNVKDTLNFSGKAVARASGAGCQWGLLMVPGWRGLPS